MVQDNKVKEIIKNDIWDTMPETDVHIYQSRPLQHSGIPANTNGGGR